MPDIAIAQNSPPAPAAPVSTPVGQVPAAPMMIGSVPIQAPPPKPKLASQIKAAQKTVPGLAGLSPADQLASHVKLPEHPQPLSENVAPFKVADPVQPAVEYIPVAAVAVPIPAAQAQAPALPGPVAPVTPPAPAQPVQAAVQMPVAPPEPPPAQPVVPPTVPISVATPAPPSQQPAATPPEPAPVPQPLFQSSSLQGLATLQSDQTVAPQPTITYPEAAGSGEGPVRIYSHNTRRVWKVRRSARAWTISSSIVAVLVVIGGAICWYAVSSTGSLANAPVVQSLLNK